MEINEVVFPDSLPKLDLHGYDRETARVAINDFIADNIKMGNEIITIVHGIGSGIIKETTHKTLTNNKKVIDFKSFYNNRGCTIVKIKLTK
ncbi:MAG: Smr/MutS family protein [Bacilli bacterium]|nr:Smr/MutS family protein [Bacilli bacterium]